MVAASRYNVGGDEADILKNKLGITDVKELEDAETILLTDAYEHFLNLLEGSSLEINLDLLFKIHDYFLSPLYTWAGKIRTVNISKGNTLFMAPQQIEKALKELGNIFSKLIPKESDSSEEIIEKLAYLHCELNVIHPFREGNGRCLRLFIDLLLANAGYEAFDFNKVAEEKYIAACKQGVLKNYEPMEKIFTGLLKK